MLRRYFATLFGLVLISAPSLATVTAVGHQLWHLDSPGVGDQAGVIDFLGSATSAGDFDCDGYGELAVGIPNRLVSGQPAARAVLVFTSGLFGE